MDAPILELISEEVISNKTSSSYKSENSKKNPSKIFEELANRVEKDEEVSQSQRSSHSQHPLCQLISGTPPTSKYSAAEYPCCPRFYKKDLMAKDPPSNKSYSSILKKPFLFRRSESLDKAVTLDEKRLIELYRQNQAVDEVSLTLSDSTRFSTTLSSSSRSSLSSPSIPDTKFKDYVKRFSGTPELEELEDVGVKLEYSEQSIQQESAAMCTAQKYLRLHRIFEFYQFLIAHLLSALPDNPVQFLLDLLDNCLAYRTGLSVPPLLYQKKHLEALFNVMDKMGSGYIDIQQYKAGMKSIGVCMYKEHIFENPLIAISKKTFVDDALTALESILIDILRRKYMKEANPPTTAPPPTPMIRPKETVSPFSSAKSSSTSTKFTMSPKRTR